MRLLVAVVVSSLGSSAFAQERFVERTPLPWHPAGHTMERAGNPTLVKAHAVPSMTARDAGGYIGGGKLFGNRVFAKGSTAATGPVANGTFGTDYAGFHVRPNRVFLAASYDPSIGPTIARAYRTDGHYPPDIFALRPFRKAVIEARYGEHE